MTHPASEPANEITVFDRAQIKRNRERAATNFAEYDFLFNWSRDQIIDRLGDVKRDFPLALEIGTRSSIQARQPDQIGTIISLDNFGLPQIIAEEEFLPIKRESLDLVLSNLTLHSVNDLPGALIQIRQSLKPDGLFLASMLGGETLYELRECLSEAELALTGGVSPRVFPFADKPQMGSLLQRAGFSLPVVDSEIVHATYDNIFKLLKDLRGMGEGNALASRHKKNASKALFMKAAQLYAEKFAEPDGRIVASFEIIFLIGWAPHESQQKPLRPGSAQTRLADALNTTEIKTGDKPQ